MYGSGTRELTRPETWTDAATHAEYAAHHNSVRVGIGRRPGYGPGSVQCKRGRTDRKSGRAADQQQQRRRGWAAHSRTQRSSACSDSSPSRARRGSGCVERKCRVTVLAANSSLSIRRAAARSRESGGVERR